MQVFDEVSFYKIFKDLRLLMFVMMLDFARFVMILDFASEILHVFDATGFCMFLGLDCALF